MIRIGIVRCSSVMDAPGTILNVIERRLLSLPKGLQKHIGRVELIAQELASWHRVDPERVRIAAKAHDLCRAMKSSELLAMAEEFHISIHQVDRREPILLHGPVAAEILRSEGLEDEGIYEGIYRHTTASVGLDSVAKVVFLADKLDPMKMKRYPQGAALKVLAHENLDKAILEFLTSEMARLLTEGHLIHPATVDARNHLLTNTCEGS